MASHTRTSRTRRHKSRTEKRRAGRSLKTPRPKRSFLGFNLPNFINLFFSSPSPSKITIKPQMQVDSEDSDPPTDPPLSFEERQRKIAVYVDRQFDAEAEREADRDLKDPNRRMNWQPDIKPTDDEWKTKRVYFHKALAEASVDTVLKKDFEKVQVLLLQPSRRPGSTQDIQKEHTKRYQEALGPEGPFHGTKNNLATKLTMMHFGLPVEPIRVQNILNAGLDLDADDPGEDHVEKPGFQRIVFSVKPLEFLDGYHERSHGFPMLRRPKPMENSTAQSESRLPEFPMGSATARGDIPRTRPIYPGATTVGMRGGEGPTQNIYLYGPNKGRVSCPSIIDTRHSREFVWRALELLHLDPSAEWEFEVDQYNNQSFKKEKYKPFVQSFMVNKFTNQAQWTNHLRKLVCDPNEDWVMVVDHPRPLGVIAPRVFEPPKHDFIPPKFPNTPTQIPDISRRLSSAGRKPSLPRTVNSAGVPEGGSFGLGLGGPPRINEEKLLAARAAIEKIPKFDPWMAEQSRLDRLKRESWHKDQSVVEPGQKPEPPLFGASKELALTVGDSMPTIYSHRLTPTDLGQILEENQFLRNKVLDRMDNCPMCDVTFASYKTDEIVGHFKTHAQQIASAGVCPECETQQWTFMNTEQRRDHLTLHRDQNDSKMIHEFWQKFDCPICDMPLGRSPNTKHPQDMLNHMAEHITGAIQYCDICGINTKEITEIEQLHHRKICIEGPYRGSAEPNLVFCDVCGKDRTTESEEGLVEHRTNCYQGLGNFCNQCGLDLGSMAAFPTIRHKSQCRPPRGFRRKFCGRCGANLSTLDENGRLAHKDMCRFIEPVSVAHDARTAGLQGESQTPTAAGGMDAHVKRQFKYVMDRAKELDEKEANLKAREAALRETRDQQTLGSRLTTSEFQLGSGDTMENPLDIPDDPMLVPEPFQWASDSQQESAGEGPSNYDFFAKFIGGMKGKRTAKTPSELETSDNNTSGSKNEPSPEKKRKRTSKGKSSDPLYRFEEDHDEDYETDLEHMEPESIDDLLLAERRKKKRKSVVRAPKDSTYRYTSEEEESPDEDEAAGSEHVEPESIDDLLPIEGKMKQKKKKRAVGIQKDTPYRYSSEEEEEEEVEMIEEEEEEEGEEVQKQPKRKSPARKPTLTTGGRTLRSRTSSSTPAPIPVTPKKPAGRKGRKTKVDEP